MKDSITFYKEWFDLRNQLTDKEFIKFLLALLNYSFNKEEPKLSYKAIIPHLKDAIKIIDKDKSTPQYIEHTTFVEEKRIERLLNRTTEEKKFKHFLDINKVSYKEEVIIDVVKNKKSYIVDFLINNKHIVEIDGGYHFTEDMIEKDKLKDKILSSKGYIVHRIKNEDVTFEKCMMFMEKNIWNMPKITIPTNKPKKNKNKKNKKNKQNKF
jgi:very-short-patch-repair endonuclease